MQDAPLAISRRIDAKARKHQKQQKGMHKANEIEPLRNG